eukprot:Opistho-1_new@10972
MSDAHITHVAGQIDHAAGVAHLVVVPGVDLEQGAVGHHRGGRIHDGTARVACVVGADQRPRLVAQDAGERASGRGGEQRVHLLGRGLAFELEHAVGQRGIQRRHAHRMAVELALELGVDQRDRGRAAGGRGRQAHQRAAGAAQVLVRCVHHQVGVGRVVQRGDLAVADADGLVHHLHHGREAVGGAGGGGHDAVARGLVLRVVHTHDDVEHAPHLHRRGHDHTLRAAVQVALDGVGREELAGALQHQVHAQIAPGNLRRRAVGAERHPPFTDADDVFALCGDVGAPLALHAVEGQQVGGGGRPAL